MDNRQTKPDEGTKLKSQEQIVDKDDAESRPVAGESRSLPATAQLLTGRALEFLSTASNETLSACLLGLGIITYVILGRVGLVLIGVVGGVVLHASWDGETQGDANEPSRAVEGRRRKETGLDVAHRVLAWRSRGSNAEAEDQRDTNLDVKLFSGKQLDYSGFKPETADALNEVTDAVIRDYVKPADTFLDFVTHSTSIVIVFLSELATALAASPSAPAETAIAAYLELKPESNLSNILDTKHQERKLDMVAEDILQSFLDPKTYNCEPARVFLREVLAKMILDMTIQSCSKPEWINDWIVYLLEEGEPELLNVIDASVGRSANEALQEGGKRPVELENSARPSSPEGQHSNAAHKRRVSRAQDAMDEAMREAQRLTQLMAEEDARRLREQQVAAAGSSDDVSESTTQGVFTPTSSQSDMNGDGDAVVSENASMESSRDHSRAAEGSESFREEPVAPSAAKSTFTSFDQLVPVQAPTALGGTPTKPSRDPLTLFNANISIFDDSVPNDRTAIRSKPATEYLIQIEPTSSHHSGWMIARKFADFETLHEVLRRISVISGVGFVEAHPSLPNWRGYTKASLRGELERYLNDAVHFRPLAESEGMRRFLEKETGLNQSPSTSKGGFPGIGWPAPSAFESMGKGMIDVLAKAPKEVAGGGKAFFGGVTGVLGGVGSIVPKKGPASARQLSQTPASSPSRHVRDESVASGFSAGRKSTDSLRGQQIVDTQPAPITQMEYRPSSNPDFEAGTKPRLTSSSRSSLYSGSREQSRAPSVRECVDDISPTYGGDQIMNLPPLPTDISDDYDATKPMSLPQPRGRQSLEHERPPETSVNDVRDVTATAPIEPPSTKAPPESPNKQQPKPQPPLTEQETQVTIELLFAVINELYTLSSAWTLRKTLLSAAKTFLLRPGNPQLESIRVLLNSTVLEANTSDAGIAAHLRKLRENALPTEEELKGWPKPLDEEEKERLRRKARRLLVERGCRRR
ncbi:hypothetical protein H2199_000710 [Coniosporium tulheliwenetii]|uniref:Uncharacterized protein n=1 Tax=Coniosporium tulheliwenetii TaxID=3383036 RepID=A0ACC2ZMS1_9PEZI|nr:hypothetical protein H2199_000710 [Cladosporium sp. JES 115]